MGVSLTYVSVGWLLYAVAALVLIAFILRAEHLTRGHIGLCVLLGQQAAGTVAAVAMFGATDPGLFAGAYHAGVVFWLLWGPAVFLAGALLLESSPFKRWFALVCAAGAVPPVALLAMGAFRPGLVFTPDGFSLTPLATQMLLVSFVALAVVVCLLAFDAMTTPLPLRRAQYSLLAAAFGVEAAFHTSQNALKLALDYDFHGLATLSMEETVLTIVPAVLLGGATVGLAAVSWRSLDADVRKWARVIAGFLLAAGVTGAATSNLLVGEEFVDPTGLIHTVWDLLSLCFLVYAGLKFQLFSVERHARRGVIISCFLGVGAVLFLTAQEILEGVLSETFFAGIPLPSVVAAFFVSIASLPVAKVAQTAGKKLFPQVDLSSSYEKRRREEIYQAAIEGALLDGAVSTKEALTLKNLRDALGISDDDHSRIETRVRGHLGARLAAA